jgi:tripartite-type tricarboxylate transporter receptor subunit TctC
MRCFNVCLPCIAVTLALSPVAYTQTYPTKPVRIVTAGPGSTSDATTRIIAQALTGPLGQQVIVDNRPSGVIPGQVVAQAAPDGYTLLLYGSALWLAALLQDVPYAPLRDFAPVTLATRAPLILVVHPALPAKSVKDVIALAKARPNELNYASGGTGSAAHIAAEIFKSMAGVQIVEIPYKSGASQMADLTSGQVQVMFSLAATALPHVRSGRLRALAITTADRSPLLPELPTIAASGVPGYESSSWQAILAPAKTPAAVISHLNQEIRRALGQQHVREKLGNLGLEITASSPEQLAQTMKADMARMAKVFKLTGVRAN